MTTTTNAVPAHNFRQHSKDSFAGPATIEAINAGSLQRIADATEAMAKNHTQLIRERDMYEKLYREQAEKAAALRRQLSAAKGQITKLRTAAERTTRQALAEAGTTTTSKETAG